MRNSIKLTLLMLGVSVGVRAQDFAHYTMFMHNKLMYNPAYAGSRDGLSANAFYRQQWVGLDGAPRNLALTVDARLGSYTNEFRHVGLGVSVNNEEIGVTRTTNLMTYYSYRIRLGGKNVLAFGLQAGVALFSSHYSDLNGKQPIDNVLTNDIRNAGLPNGGAGVYLSGDRYYAGLSCPNFFENYYDNTQRNFRSGAAARQSRSFFASAGYRIPLSEQVSLLPQGLLRYTANEQFMLPLSADVNLSVVLYNRLMLGATYRTDNTVAGVVHVQAFNHLNIGYSYDLSTGGSASYGVNRGSHEVTVGVDLRRDNNSYANPRFISNF